MDYTLDNEGYLGEFLNDEYHDWGGRRLFNNDVIELPQHPPDAFLDSFVEMLHNTDLPEFPLDSETRFAIGLELLNNNAYLTAINGGMANDMDFLMRLLFSIDTTEIDQAGIKCSAYLIK